MTHFADLVAAAGTMPTVELPTPQEMRDTNPFPEGTMVRYYTANLSDPKSKEKLEYILTTSLKCRGVLKSNGDLVVISESGTFDKDGCYNIMVKYFELCTE